MTHRNDAASRVLDRWRMLAERRLEYLTELFESGRWRRYYSERNFLENIKEAKEAVETWRGLATPMPITPRAFPRPAPAPPIQLRKMAQAALLAPGPIEWPLAAETEIVPSIEADVPAIDLLELEQALEGPTLDFAAIEQRYPLLRNTL
jgi:hypothetical protein